MWSDPEDVETWAVSQRGAGWLFRPRVTAEIFGENIALTANLDTKKEVPITMVTSRGIGAEDVKRIEDAGIHTCDFLITNTNTKQVLTDIGFPKAMVDKIWGAAKNMVNYNSKADISIQNSVRELSAIAAKSNNDTMLAACADFSSCLEKRFSLCELQQYMYKHRFEAQVTKKYYDQFCSKDKIRAKAYGYFAEEAYQRRREERLQDLKIKSTIAIVDPKEVPIKMVTVRGIGAEDVKRIEDAGILTCDFLITNTKLVLTDIGFPEAMVDKIWKAANKMLTDNSRADSFIQNSVREFNVITAKSNNEITLAARDDLSSCLEKRFSLSELQQYMRKHCFKAHITKKYYDLFCSKDKIGAKAYGHYAEEASRRRSEQRLLDCQIITRVEPEDANNFPQNDELPLRMLIARGIDKEHLKLIDNAGISSCDSLITYTKQDLTAITELSEATIDNIWKEAKDMVGYTAGTQVGQVILPRTQMGQVIFPRRQVGQVIFPRMQVGQQDLAHLRLRQYDLAHLHLRQYDLAHLHLRQYDLAHLPPRKQDLAHLHPRKYDLSHLHPWKYDLAHLRPRQQDLAHSRVTRLLIVSWQSL